MSLPRECRSTQARRRGVGLWPALNPLLLTAVCLSSGSAADGLALKDRPHIRRPIAAALIESQQLLAIANQKSGSISVVDYPAKRVLDEIGVGQRLTDLKVHAKTGWLLASDDKTHELIVLERFDNSLTVRQRLPVSPYPANIAISPSGKRISVASLWSRAVTVFEVQGSYGLTGPSLNRIASIRLAFNPGEHSFMASEDYVTVKDAFARRFEAVSISDWRSGRAQSTQAAPPLPAADHGYGRASRSESSQVIGGTEFFFYGGAKILLGPAPELTPAERGEQLFFDRGLSGDRSLSCHSCHVHGHSTYQLADTLGDDTTGTPKRIPTLLGTRLTDPWAWNGKQRDLSEQVRKSLDTTMHAKNFTPQQVGDLVAYLHTLEPPPALQPATDDPADRDQLGHGQALFQNLGCGKCHVPPLTYTSPDVYDVGLADEQGLTKFNPPSLRGVSQGYTFFHDGRAKSLEEVFTGYGHMLNRELANNELADLLRFLCSL